MNVFLRSAASTTMYIKCLWHIYVCVCVWEGVGGKSPDPISCLLPVPISIFALWQLASNPKCRICKWLWVRGSIFCHSQDAPQEDHLEPGGHRAEQRLRASQFWLYVHKPRQPGGFQCPARSLRYMNRNTVTYIIHHLTVNTLPSSTHTTMFRLLSTNYFTRIIFLIFIWLPAPCWPVLLPLEWGN